MAKRIDLTGQRFGHLVVVEPVGPIWRCRCDCGGETMWAAGQLRWRSKRQKSPMTCGCGCYKTGANAPLWKGHGEISARLWRNITHNSRTRGHPFYLSIEEAWTLFQQQGRRCALTGEPLHFPRSSKDLGDASLDRIDSSQGYSTDNCQWVHKTVNIMKWDLPLPHFVRLCGLVVEPIKGPPMLGWVPTTRHGNWRGHGGITRNFWSQYPRNAATRNLPFNLSIEEAWELLCVQEGRCAVTGLPIFIRQHHKAPASTASLDRLDNAKGYTATNIHWVHKDVNAKLRRHLRLPELREWAEKVAAGP